MSATAFAVFAAGWMLLVMQPCLAALDPPAGPHAGHHDCPHCPVEVTPPCAATALDCGTPDAAAAGDKPSAKAPAVALYQAPAAVTHPDLVAHAGFRHERPDPTGPPFTERYCCFLE